MVAEPDPSRVRSDEEIAKIVSMVVQGLLPQLQRPQYGSSSREIVEDKRKVWRIEKYGGDPAQFRMWVFNLKVAIGQVDSSLAQEVSKILMREDASKFPSDWDPARDTSVDK
eukprot:12285010-Karenia_brevis.AAC.1